jgi:basic amino acid/polyamine antiporter, APA family
LILHDLPRKLGLLDAACIIIGVVIGSGIFVLPNLIARELFSPAAILSVWAITGVLSYVGSLAYAELGAMMPATGGQYIYLREAYGPLAAFLCGWTFMLAVLSGGIAWLAVTFSIYLGQFAHLNRAESNVISLALIAVLSAVNYVGVRPGALVQRTFTFLKIAGLVLLIGSAFLSPYVTHPAPLATKAAFSPGHFGVAMIACLMAYNGWTFVSFIAGEVKEPERNLPRGLAVGMAGVVALYLLANVAYLKVMAVSQIAGTERVGAALAQLTLGSAGATIVSITVLLSIIGAINGCIMTGARIPFAQARDGLFFSRFGRIHPRFETPSFAIVIQGIWTGILILSGSYENLFSYSMIAAWIFYSMTAGAVALLRRKLPEIPRPYKMWGYPYTLFLFLSVSVWFIVNAFITQPMPSLAALVIAATGFPMYRIWARPALKPRAAVELNPR